MASDKGLHRHDERLNTQKHRVHNGHRIDAVEIEAMEEAELLVLQAVVIAGIGVRDAGASRRNIGEAALVQGLQRDGQRARTHNLLRVNELVPVRNCPAAMKSCTEVTTMGMTVNGFDKHATSAIMPGRMTCASIWENPA